MLNGLPRIARHCQAIALAALTLTACQESNNPSQPHSRGGSARSAAGGSGASGASRDVIAGTAATSSTLLARSTFSDPHDQNLMIKRIADDWHFELKTDPAMDVAVQSINFPPGSSSGWHTHPGPVLIQVVSGTVTFYEGDDPTCTPIVRTAGESYLDFGVDTHIGRNEGSVPAVNIVTYFAPPGAALKIPQPSPGNCPF